MLQRRTLLATAMITSNKWNLISLDVKTTFLHSKVMEKVVYVTSFTKPTQTLYGGSENAYMT